VQRTNRDHFGAIADQTHRSLSDAVLAAKQSAGTFAAERDGRARELTEQLRTLELVARKVPQLPPAPVPQAVGR
jgi:hypothetical protein